MAARCCRLPTSTPTDDPVWVFSQTWAGEGNWRYPVNLITPGLISYNFYAEYYMNTDRSVLLVSLEKGDGMGLKDIYVCFSENQLTWTFLMNLGKQINTAAEEMAPAYRLTAGISSSPPTDTLVGGRTSIFPKRLDDTWKNWSVPQNLGPEISSIGFDAYFTFNDSSGMPISPLPAMATLTRHIQDQLKPVEEEEEEEEDLLTE